MLHLWVVFSCIVIALVAIYALFVMVYDGKGSVMVILFLTLLAVPLALITTHLGIF